MDHLVRPLRAVLLVVLMVGVAACAPRDQGTRPIPTPITPVTRATQEARAAQRTATPRPAGRATTTAAADVPPGEAAILAAYEERLSGIIVEVEGRVRRTLSDDNEGSRHQRFILELRDGHTVLVAHNIDLAPRVEGLSPGDTVRVRGEYEWNEQGGVIHWTHHDPRGRHAEGFIEFEGVRYR